MTDCSVSIAAARSVQSATGMTSQLRCLHIAAHQSQRHPGLISRIGVSCRLRALCGVNICSLFGVTAKKSCAVRKGTPASAATIHAAQGVVQAAGSVITQYPESLPTTPPAPACPSFTPNNSQNNSPAKPGTDSSVARTRADGRQFWLRASGRNRSRFQS